MNTATLFEEYREDVLECIHQGMICVVDENGIKYSAGDTDWTCYYRSCSKTIQSLPVLMRGLDAKYGLTDEEVAVFSGSHFADPDHVAVLESILAKTGLKEEQMIMLPTYPNRQSEKERLLREGKPPRKIYHNCSGKHLALMLLARDLGEPVEKYWVRKSRTQDEVIRVISMMSDVPTEEIRVGVDGCGVPVYAVPFHAIAKSYLRFVRPEMIEDPVLRAATVRNVNALQAYPNMISGKGNIITLLTANPDIFAKGGAQGVCAMAIKSMGLGIVFKIMDGSQEEFASCAINILDQLGYDPQFVGELRAKFTDIIVNNNKEDAGYRKAVFSLK